MENPSKIGWFEKYPYCRKPLPIFLHSADVFTKKCSTAEIHSENELRCQPQSCSNTVGTKTEIHLWSAIFHIICIYIYIHIYWSAIFQWSCQSSLNPPSFRQTPRPCKQCAQQRTKKPQHRGPQLQSLEECSSQRGQQNPCEWWNTAKNSNLHGGGSKANQFTGRASMW